MENRGKFVLISSLLATSLMACGTIPSNKTADLNHSSSLSTNKPKVAEKKSDVLIIGGKSEPFSTIVGNLTAFSSNDKKKNLSLVWSGEENLSQDFENQEFFTVINKMDPQSKAMTLTNFFGLDTSVTALSKQDGKIVFATEQHENNPSYNLVVGNQTIAMSWDKKEQRFVPNTKILNASTNEQTSSDVLLQKNGERVVQTQLPLFSISSENFQQLQNVKLNLSETGYAEPITIQTTSEETPNCVILAAWKNGTGESGLMLTNFIHDNQIDFSNLEREKLEQIKSIKFDAKMGTAFVCVKIQSKSDENPYNTFVISVIPITLEVVSENTVEAPAVQIEKPETQQHQSESTNGTLIKVEPLPVKAIKVEQPVVNVAPSKGNIGQSTKKKNIVQKIFGKKDKKDKKDKKENKTPVAVDKKENKTQDKTNKKNSTPDLSRRTVDGYKLQINQIDDLSFPTASVSKSNLPN